MTVDYYQKYLKYKAKYLQLKEQMGNAYGQKFFNYKCMNGIFIGCKCTKFSLHAPDGPIDIPLREKCQTIIDKKLEKNVVMNIKSIDIIKFN